WPLELAEAGGRPLAARGDVTFAYDLAPDQAGRGPDGDSGAIPGDRGLRMLAVFSLPTQLSVLALRRERFELARLVRGVGGRRRGRRRGRGAGGGWRSRRSSWSRPATMPSRTSRW